MSRLQQLQALAEQGFNAIKFRDYATAKPVVIALFKHALKLHPMERPVVWSMAKLMGAMLALEVDQAKPVRSKDGDQRPVEVAREFVLGAIEQAGLLGQPWPAAQSFLALVCSRMGLFDEAIAAAQRAVDHQPDFWQGWNNLGDAYVAAARYDEAYAAFEEGSKHKRMDPSLLFNRGLIDLLRGDYVQGFKRYEMRWHIPEYVRDHGRTFHETHPQWFGGPLDGKTLLLHAEQGHGDMIQQLRYIPWVQSHNPARIILEAHKPLIRFIQRRVPGVEVVTLGDDLPAFDVWCSMMSLCALHGTRLDHMMDLDLRRAA